MRTVVVGATGRIGSRLLAELRDQGEDVVGTSSRPEISGVLHVAPDDVAALTRAVKPADVLVVLAGATTARPLDGMHLNAVAAATAVEAGSRAGAARIVLASSAAVYGDRRDRPLRENDPVDPLSRYAHSKLEAEQALESFPGETVALRIFNVYGEGFDDSLVAKVLTSAAKGGHRTRGADDFVRDYVHVDTVVQALQAARTAPLPERHAVVNVATGVRTTTRDLVALVARKRAVEVTFGAGDGSWSWGDTTAMTAVLGVRPASLSEVLAGLSPDPSTDDTTDPRRHEAPA